MATWGDLRTISREAAGDLSANQYNFVRIDTNGQTNVASENSHELNVGVLLNKPEAAGRAASIGYDGESKVVAGGTCTVGQWVTTNGSGRAVDATSGNMIMGRAMEAASSDGEIIRVLLQPPIFWAAT